MRIVLQRVSQAEVRVDGNVVGKIGPGLLILLGVAKDDTESDLDWLVEKVCNLRIFPNEAGKFDRSIKDISGEILVVSQFTLYGDCRKGRRPDFTEAAPPQKAEELYNLSIDKFKAQGLKTESGQFGAMMDVKFINQGPVTLTIDSPRKS